MIEILQCNLYKPLKLLKLYGFRNEEVNEDILIYKQNVLLGSAEADIWTTEKNMPDTGKVNWVFTKVVSNIKAEDTIIVRVISNEQKNLFEKEVGINIVEDVPSSLTSEIGTKNSLTINTGKDAIEDFVKQQEAYGYKPPLRHLTIESSSMCNLKCKYCIVSNNYHAIERCVISEEVFKEAIAAVNRLYEQGLRSIQLNALGEPLTNTDFVGMVRTIYEETQIRNITFFNNGMLFSKEVSDALTEIPIQFKIFFSIDGHSPKENDSYRVGSEYDKLKQNIFYFLHKIARKTNFTIIINNLQINTMQEETAIPDFLLNDFGFVQIDSHRAFYFPELSGKKLKKDKISTYAQSEKKICKRIFSESTIRANGDIIRCHWDSTCEIVMGNILKDKLENIWGENMYHIEKTC